jgi:hypothetical protein
VSANEIALVQLWGTIFAFMIEEMNGVVVNHPWESSINRQ